MFDLTRKDSIAAALAAEGMRVTTLTGSIGVEYLFYGAGVTICTSDTDCRIKIEQLPRTIASLVVSYLRATK